MLGWSSITAHLFVLSCERAPEPLDIPIKRPEVIAHNACDDQFAQVAELVREESSCSSDDDCRLVDLSVWYRVRAEAIREAPDGRPLLTSVRARSEALMGAGPDSISAGDRHVRVQNLLASFARSCREPDDMSRSNADYHEAVCRKRRCEVANIWPYRNREEADFCLGRTDTVPASIRERQGMPPAATTACELEFDGMIRRLHELPRTECSSVPDCTLLVLPHESYAAYRRRRPCYPESDDRGGREPVRKCPVTVAVRRSSEVKALQNQVRDYRERCDPAPDDPGCYLVRADCAAPSVCEGR